ncbi:MAG: hypothetical protein ACAI34_12050 [Verrucomicrobium sp.]|nr:hypothetical protein [Verrucomicrobium sp.]
MAAIVCGIIQLHTWNKPRVSAMVVGYERDAQVHSKGGRALFRLDDDLAKTVTSTQVSSAGTYKVGDRVTVILEDGGRLGTPVEKPVPFFIFTWVALTAALGNTGTGLILLLLSKVLERVGRD